MNERACPGCRAKTSEFDVRCAACGATLPHDTVTTAPPVPAPLPPDTSVEPTTAPVPASRSDGVAPPASAADIVKDADGAAASHREWDRFRRGATFGRFTVVDRLGDGGMGIV